jgi:hypothetical protein
MATEVQSFESEEQAEALTWLLVVVSLVGFILTGNLFFTALCAAGGLMYVAPVKHIRKFFGYIVVADAVFGIYLMHVASGTFGGFSVAVVAGLVYAFISREACAWFGYERLSVDGETTLGNQFARFLTYRAAWLKSVWNGLVSGKEIVAPPALQIQWVDVQGASFKDTRTYRTIRYGWEWMVGRLGMLIV